MHAEWTEIGAPIVPARTRSRNFATTGWNRSVYPTEAVNFFSSQSAIKRSIPARFAESGFSISKCSPAWAQRTPMDTWESAGVAITAASNLSKGTALRSMNELAHPYRSAISLARTSFGSTRETETPSMWRKARICRSPIDPAPMTITRMTGAICIRCVTRLGQSPRICAEELSLNSIRYLRPAERDSATALMLTLLNGSVKGRRAASNFTESGRVRICAANCDGCVSEHELEELEE